jgi:hypothetical protein
MRRISSKKWLGMHPSHKLLTFITAGIAVLALPCSGQALAEDKQKHLAVSATMGVALQTVQTSRAVSYGTCLGVGAAKEVYDTVTPNHDFEIADLAFDAIGCALGIEGVQWLRVQFQSENHEARLILKWHLGG